MVSSGTAVVVYAFLSTSCLLCQMDEVLTEALASGASHPLNLAIHRASKGELSGEAAKAAGTLFLSYLVRDQVSTITIINFVVSMYALSAVLAKAMFLGPLSAIEAGKLSERMLKFLMLKLVFIAAVSGPGLPEIAVWVSWFAVVGWLKMFVGLARDRFDSLISSPTATFAAHARTLALLLLLFANDIAWIVAFVSSHERAPLSHLMLWLFDTVVAALEAAAILVKYGIFVADQLHERQGWEGKGASGDFLYKVELATDMAVKSLTLSHLTHIWWLHGFAFRLLDGILFLDIRYLFCSICSGVRRYHKYMKATHNLNHRFRDAKLCELETQNGDCAICREKMQAAKALPCGHIFHLGCLTAWLQQSGSDNFTCPLCRLALFADEKGESSGQETRLYRAVEDVLAGADQDASEHDVEATTFSSQVVGQALAEAARSLAEGGNTFLRQNWAAEVSRLELMVQNLRDRLLQHRHEGSAMTEGLHPPPRQLPSQSFASSAVPSSLLYVEELEQQLDAIRDSLAVSSAQGSQDALCQVDRRSPRAGSAAAESLQADASQASMQSGGQETAVSSSAPRSSPRRQASRTQVARSGAGGVVLQHTPGSGISSRGPWPSTLVDGGFFERLQAWIQPDYSAPHRVNAEDVAAVQTVLPHIPEEVIIAELQVTPVANAVIEKLLDTSLEQ